jgi:signal transduction histidine kinase
VVPAGVSVEVRQDAPQPEIVGDPAQLCLAFLNVIRNACEAMPRGGELTVSIRRVQDEYEVAVRDTGVGMAPENLARVAEPLFTTKPRGIGLGLAIVKAIMAKHNARWHLESAPGAGTTFAAYFGVPAAPEPVPAAAAPS